MTQRLRILACSAATALCVAMLFLWGRSTSAYDAAGVNVARFGEGMETDTLVAVESNRGSAGIFINIERDPAAQPLAKRFNYGAMHGPAQPIDELSSLAGFRYQWRTWPGHNSATVVRVMVPYWALALFAGWVALRALGRIRREQSRVRYGLCAGCGYDLRGSDVRCPECGQAVRRSSASSSAAARDAEELAA